MSEISQNTLKVRHDWYQTETHVVLNILVKNVQEKDFSLKYEPESVIVCLILVFVLATYLFVNAVTKFVIFILIPNL